MFATTYRLEDVKSTQKAEDYWWISLVINRVSVGATFLIANYTPFHPNLISVFSLFVGVGAALAFLQATEGWLLCGAILFQLSLILDSVDGKLARLTGKTSQLGSMLDIGVGLVVIVSCGSALVFGQFQIDTSDSVIILGILYLIFYPSMSGFAVMARIIRLTNNSSGRFDLVARFSAGRRVVGQSGLGVFFLPERLPTKSDGQINPPREHSGITRLRLRLGIRTLPSTVEAELFAFTLGPAFDNLFVGFLVGIFVLTIHFIERIMAVAQGKPPSWG